MSSGLLAVNGLSTSAASLRAQETEVLHTFHRGVSTLPGGAETGDSERGGQRRRQATGQGRLLEAPQSNGRPTGEVRSVVPRGKLDTGLRSSCRGAERALPSADAQNLTTPEGGGAVRRRWVMPAKGEIGV